MSDGWPLSQREAFEVQKMEMVRTALESELGEAKQRINETISKAMKSLDGRGNAVDQVPAQPLGAGCG